MGEPGITGNCTLVNGKTCNECGIFKFLTDYYDHPTCLYGKDAKCKACQADLQRKALQDPAKRQAHRERCRKVRLKSCYGLTVEQYDEMVLAQEGCCLICGASDPMLHIDHCHTSGRVRGLLCGYCNRGLGFFKDNTEALRSAINYLEET